MDNIKDKLNFDIPLDFDIPQSVIFQSCNLKIFSPLEKFTTTTVAEKLFIRLVFAVEENSPTDKRYILSQFTLGTSMENRSEYNDLDTCKKAYVYILMDYVIRNNYTILSVKGNEILDKLKEYEEAVLGCKL